MDSCYRGKIRSIPNSRCMIYGDVTCRYPWYLEASEGRTASALRGPTFESRFSECELRDHHAIDGKLPHRRAGHQTKITHNLALHHQAL